MVKRICDLCGEEIPRDASAYKITIGYADVLKSYGDLTTQRMENILAEESDTLCRQAGDVCRSCASNILEYMYSYEKNTKALRKK